MGWSLVLNPSETAKMGRRTRQLDPFSHLSYSPAPSQPSAAWRLRTNHRFRSTGAMSESTQTDAVQYGADDTRLTNEGGLDRGRDRRSSFLVGAVAFQFLRPKVGAAQENTLPNDSTRTNARSQRRTPGSGPRQQRTDRLRQRGRRMHAALRPGSSGKLHQPHDHRSGVPRSRASPSRRPR